MANYPNFDQFQSKAGYTTESSSRSFYSENAVATLMRNMYVWMAIALVITGLILLGTIMFGQKMVSNEIKRRFMI
jgi:FtsH-binding integral membrane protein